MKEPQITFNELMKELDNYRDTKFVLTKDQKDFILKCRENKNPITWTKMSELWAKLGWGRMPISTLRDKYRKIKIGEL